MCIRDRQALAPPLANPTLSSLSAQRPPSGPERRERFRGCAEAWRTPLAGTPPAGGRRTRPHRRRHAGAPYARQRGKLYGPRAGGRQHGPAA
eukprot:14151993-Alexandrium_andersonii.AAC.1